MNEDTTQEVQDTVQDTGGEVQATSEDVKELYEDLGIDAPVPTGKTRGRPKSTSVRAKDSDTKGDKRADSGQQEDKKSQEQPKDAQPTSDDGDSGDSTDKESKEVSKDTGEVSEKPDKTGDRVRKGESETEEDSERGDKEDSEAGDGESGKRPGKSNPAIEKRFQKLTNDVRERDEQIEYLREQLQESSRKFHEQEVASEDPEYTLEDFRVVHDGEGGVIELDEDEAELAYRRWQDGYQQRQAERSAEYNKQLQAEQEQYEHTQRLMQSSVEAYDTLASLADTYPQLDDTSPDFDPEFSQTVMPLIEQAIIYQPGTEPGNPDNLQPVIVGMTMDPNAILGAMSSVQQAKRALPLNGLNDSVDVGGGLSVQHGRTSNEMAKAANDLYKELGIEKRY